MTDTNPGGWPDPARPGVPLNPEQEGHHWCCVYPSLPFCIIWRHDGIGWCWGNGYTPKKAATHWRYLGPCLLPAEIAARVAAARADALREAARIAVKVRQSANDCAREPDLIANIRREYLAQARGAEDVEEAILAAIPEPAP